MNRVKRIWYLSPVRAAKVQASLRIRAVSPEPSLLAHTSSESRGTFGQKARSLAPLNGWACVVKICHDGMLEDTNSLDGAQMCLAALYVLNSVHNAHPIQTFSLYPVYTARLVLQTELFLLHYLNILMYPLSVFSRAEILITTIMHDITFI